MSPEEDPQQSINPQLEPTFYEVLGVAQNASEQDIKKAYSGLAFIYHPDKNVGKSQDEITLLVDKFKKINLAYQILSNPNSRTEYDQTLTNSNSYNSNITTAGSLVVRNPNTPVPTPAAAPSPTSGAAPASAADPTSGAAPTSGSTSTSGSAVPAAAPTPGTTPTSPLAASTTSGIDAYPPGVAPKEKLIAEEPAALSSAAAEKEKEPTSGAVNLGEEIRKIFKRAAGLWSTILGKAWKTIKDKIKGDKKIEITPTNQETKLKPEPLAQIQSKEATLGKEPTLATTDSSSPTQNNNLGLSPALLIMADKSNGGLLGILAEDLQTLQATSPSNEDIRANKAQIFSNGSNKLFSNGSNKLLEGSSSLYVQATNNKSKFRSSEKKPK